MNTLLNLSIYNKLQFAPTVVKPPSFCLGSGLNTGSKKKSRCSFWRHFHFPKSTASSRFSALCNVVSILCASYFRKVSKPGAKSTVGLFFSSIYFLIPNSDPKSRFPIPIISELYSVWFFISQRVWDWDVDGGRRRRSWGSGFWAHDPCWHSATQLEGGGWA